MCINRCLICIFILITSFQVTISSIFATEKNRWEFVAGTKSFYSSGMAKSNLYYKPFGKVEYCVSIFTLSTVIARYINYQITDAMGEYENINFNELDLAFETNLSDWLYFSLEYKYSSGDFEYNKNSYLAEITFDYRMISFTGEINRIDTDYSIDASDIKIDSYAYSFILDYYISDSTSFDFGYSFTNDYYSSIDSDYNKSLFRLGVINSFESGLNLISGLSGGWDSDDYAIIGFDIGFIYKIRKYLKVLSLYSLQYYRAPAVTTTTLDDSRNNSGQMGNHSNNSSLSTFKGSNPYLNPSKKGESYYSQIISLGINLIF